ncbi:MAG: TRAP transporter large permease subunit, partial [Planctomycetes bacterium]|nr:TRAP transporter large permease subunit [Planctomycetota bacterium]
MVALLHVLVLALLGLPLFIVIGLAAALGYASVRPEPLHPKLLFTDAYQQIATQPLFLTIPLFTFAGYLLSESRAPVRLVALSRAWLGWVPGGISVVVVLVSCLFTAITGASGVTIIALGGLLLPILLRDGHPDRFSVGLVTTCGSMGLLFPPSLPIIIYAVIAGPVTSKTFQKHGLSGGAVDIDRLFRAGLLPGLLMVAVLAAWCVWVARRTRPEREPFRGGEALRALRAALPELAIPAIILGGIYGGLGTTADVSAVTALYVFAVEVLLYRDIRPSQVPGIVHRSMVLVGAILVIMIASLGLTNYLSDQQVPERILATLGGRIADPGAARAAARALEEAGRPLAASPVLSARATRRSCKAAARSLDEAALGLEWGLGALAARAGLEGVAVLAGPGVPPATGDMAEALGGETGEGVPARSAA